MNRLKPDPYCVSGNLLCHTALNLGTPEGLVAGISNLQNLLDFTTTSTWSEDKLLSERRSHRLELPAAFFWSRVLSNIMPKWTLTPIQQSRFFPLERTSRVVVSYIPERRVKAEEQNQGTADGAAAGFAVGQERQTRCTSCLLGAHPKVSVHKVERGMTEWTRNSVVFFGQVWEVTTKFKCWQTEWEWTHKSRQLRLSQTSESHWLKPCKLLWSFCPSLALELGTGRTGVAPKLSCLASCCSSIHPTSFKACLKCTYRTRQKMSSSSLKWHKIAKTTRRERWWSCWKENWNNLKDSALFSLLSAWRRYLDKGF